MKSNNILNIIKGQNIVVPSFLIKTYKQLNINCQELIFLSFLLPNGEKILFDVESFSKHLNMDISEIMNLIATLTEKKLITMEVSKNSKGMMVEYLDIGILYAKILNFLVEIPSETNNSNIYEIIEKEFGRTLSPIEYETIKGWLDASITEDLIKEALKEAILNGVTNLKYIDKILYEWNKKGWNKVADVKKKVAVTETNENVKLFDYDWLDDND